MSEIDGDSAGEEHEEGERRKAGPPGGCGEDQREGDGELGERQGNPERGSEPRRNAEVDQHSPGPGTIGQLREAGNAEDGDQHQSCEQEYRGHQDLLGGFDDRTSRVIRLMRDARVDH